MDKATDIALLPPPSETSDSETVEITDNPSDTAAAEKEEISAEESVSSTKKTEETSSSEIPTEEDITEDSSQRNPLRLLARVVLVLLGLFASVIFTVTLMDSTGHIIRTGIGKIALGELFGGTANITLLPIQNTTDTSLPPSAEIPDTPANEGGDSHAEAQAPSDKLTENTETETVPSESVTPIGIVTADLSAKGENGLALINETPYTPTLIPKSERAIPTLPEIYREYGTDAPVVLIIHTHGTESYAEDGALFTSESEYRSLDSEENMLSVGKALAEVLTARGINTIFCEEMFDAEDFTMAYYNASLKIRTLLSEYPSISYILDLHRDSISYGNGEKTLRPTTIIDGEAYAQMMFVVGTDHGGSGHTEWTDNFNLACRLQSKIHDRHSNLMRSVNLRSASFNQQYTKGSLLIEMGAVGSSIEEAKRSARLLGEFLADEIIGNTALQEEITEEDSKELRPVLRENTGEAVIPHTSGNLLLKDH